MGLDATDDAVIQMMKLPIYGCEAGQAIAIYAEASRSGAQVAESMFRVVTEWGKLHGRFLRLCVGCSVYPGRDSIPHMPEPMETRDDVDYDLRDPEERHRAAKAAWDIFDRDCKILTPREKEVAFDGVWQVNGRPLHYLSQEAGGKPQLTTSGVVFVGAIRKLADAM